MPNRPTINLLACIFTVNLLISCSTLKPVQLTAVEKYAIATKGISDIPSDLYFRAYQLRSQAQSIQLSGIISTNQSEKESIDALQLDFSDKFKFLDLVDSFSYAYKIVGNYASLVHALISTSYYNEFSKDRKQWRTSFDGLVTNYNKACLLRVPPSKPIPTSVGIIASTIINEMGSMKIKTLQKKYLKNAIHEAREPFEGICDDFLNTDVPKIKRELQNLPSFINENYKDFLNHIKYYETQQGNNPYNYYKYYLPVYANWQLQLKELNLLVDKLSVCIQDLRNGYGHLENFINTENPGTEIPAELQKLDADYINLTETIARFTAARDRLFKISY
ncbi:MAG: hypothetical protein JST34_05155 [Bacteroidetes bacterium]|nr:hypothetical protein [Bacteroidota bacterium]MCB0707789.1 hypothetical protein [Chitinophagaceae bacterium]